MAKKAKEAKGLRSSKLALWAVIIIAVFLVIRWQRGEAGPATQIKEDISQLTSISQYVGNGVATRSFHEDKFHLNLTAFLPKTQTGQSYQARLVSDNLEPKLVELGELSTAGDVYVLNYEGEVDLRSYRAVEVLLVNTGTQSEQVLLRGTF